MRYQILMLIAMYNASLLSMDPVSCYLDHFAAAKRQVYSMELRTDAIKQGDFYLFTDMELKQLGHGRLEELQQQCKKYIKAIGFIREMDENPAIAQHFESLKIELKEIAKTKFPANLLDIDVLAQRERQRRKETQCKDQVRKRAFDILCNWRLDFDKEKQLDVLQNNVKSKKDGYIVEKQEQAVAFKNRLETIENEVWEECIVDYSDDGDAAPIYEYVRRVF